VQLVIEYPIPNIQYPASFTYLKLTGCDNCYTDPLFILNTNSETYLSASALDTMVLHLTEYITSLHYRKHLENKIVYLRKKFRIHVRLYLYTVS